MPAISKSSVVRLSKRFTEEWNQGRLESACAIYAPHAVFVSASGIIRGKDAILRRYLEAYPDRSTMGHLKARLVDFHMSTRFAPSVATALATFFWVIELPNGQKKTGFSIETYEEKPVGVIRLIHDTTVARS